MAGTHRELVNNNVLFVDEGSQGQKTFQKWHDSDTDKVREIRILTFKPCFTAHEVYFQHYPTQKICLSPTSHKALTCFILEQDSGYRNDLQPSFSNSFRYFAKSSPNKAFVELERNLCFVISDLLRIKINSRFKTLSSYMFTNRSTRVQNWLFYSSLLPLILSHLVILRLSEFSCQVFYGRLRRDWSGVIAPLIPLAEKD